MLSTITPLSERAKGHSYRSTATWFIARRRGRGRHAGCGHGPPGLRRPAPSISRRRLIGPLPSGPPCWPPRPTPASVGCGFRSTAGRSTSGGSTSTAPGSTEPASAGRSGTGCPPTSPRAAVYLMVVLGALTAAAPVALAIGVGFGLVRGLAVLLTRHLTDPDGLRAFHRRFTEVGPHVGRAVVVVELASAVVLAAYLRAPRPWPGGQRGRGGCRRRRGRHQSCRFRLTPTGAAEALAVSPRSAAAERDRLIRPAAGTARRRRSGADPGTHRRAGCEPLRLAQSPRRRPDPPVADETLAAASLRTPASSDSGSGSEPGSDRSSRFDGLGPSTDPARVAARAPGQVAALTAPPTPQRSDPGDQQDVPATARAIPAIWTSSEPRWPSSPSHRCSSRNRSMPQSTMPTPMTIPAGGSSRGAGAAPSAAAAGTGAGRAQPPLDQQQDAEDGEVLHGLEDRNREALADLVGVVHAEPLVGRVPTAGHHELGAEQSADAPARHEHRSHQVGEAQRRELGTASPGGDEGDRHGEQQPAERGEPALPDGEDLSRVVRVVGEVGQDVEGAGADDGGDDHPHEHAGDPLPRIAGVAAVSARCSGGRTRRSGPVRSRRCGPRGTRCGRRRGPVSWGGILTEQRVSWAAVLMGMGRRGTDPRGSQLPPVCPRGPIG